MRVQPITLLPDGLEKLAELLVIQDTISIYIVRHEHGTRLRGRILRRRGWRGVDAGNEARALLRLHHAACASLHRRRRVTADEPRPLRRIAVVLH